MFMLIPREEARNNPFTVQNVSDICTEPCVKLLVLNPFFDINTTLIVNDYVNWDGWQTSQGFGPIFTSYLL